MLPPAPLPPDNVKKPAVPNGWWRLLFTKHNELDLGYAFVIPFLVLFFVAWFMAAIDRWTVTSPMWTALCAVISSMLLATVPKDRARIMRDRDYSFGGGFGGAGETTFSIPASEDAR
ncbi:MAG: hypothetical protein WD825_17225 [Gemmatimonadaceae bacterium]